MIIDALKISPVSMTSQNQKNFVTKKRWYDFKSVLWCKTPLNYRGEKCLQNKNEVSGKKWLTKKIKALGKATLGLCSSHGYISWKESEPEMSIGGQKYSNEGPEK